MKFLIILFAVALTANGMPTDIKEPVFIDASVLINNGSRSLPQGQFGFATVNGGTVGGAGGAVWTVWDAWALQDAVTGNEPRIVYVRGNIDLTVLFVESPGVFVRVGSFKSIIGGDGNALLSGGGLRISRVRNVIVQNLRIHNALSFAPGEQPNGAGGIVAMVPGPFSAIDNVGIENEAENIWVDHCEFADDPWHAASLPDNQRRHDGLIDIIRASNYISISNNIFRNHNLVTLVGHNDNNHDQDIGRLKVTFYYNWYQGVNQRNPRVRYGEVHILNNLYTDVTDYGVSVGTASEIYLERNRFVNSRRAWTLSRNVSPLGKMFNLNNSLQNTASESGIANDLSWNPSQYYGYTPMAVGTVEDYVRRNAGPL